MRKGSAITAMNRLMDFYGTFLNIMPLEATQRGGSTNVWDWIDTCATWYRVL